MDIHGKSVNMDMDMVENFISRQAWFSMRQSLHVAVNKCIN